MEFTNEEIDKVFPEVKPASDLIELKEQMGLAREKYRENEVNMILNTAITKILEAKSEMDPLDYIRLSNEYVNNKKDIRNKYQYLISTLKNDYALLLE